MEQPTRELGVLAGFFPRLAKVYEATSLTMEDLFTDGCLAVRRPIFASRPASINQRGKLTVLFVAEDTPFAVLGRREPDFKACPVHGGPGQRQDFALTPAGQIGEARNV